MKTFERIDLILRAEYLAWFFGKVGPSGLADLLARCGRVLEIAARAGDA